MAYSELIKNFERIRDYMREFYVYGFKSRDDYNKKSVRSYDNERRRIESWLGDHMQFRMTPEGKNVFLSIDSRATHHNPLYKAWKTKSFTDGDITLYFLLFDILKDPETKLSVTDIMGAIDERLAVFGDLRYFDESTVRKKLKEYISEGLIVSEKRGKTLYYGRAEDIKTYGADCLDFFSEVSPCGVIGSYLLDREEEHKECFIFKHHYITGAMDSEILLKLFEAISSKRSVTLGSVNRKMNKVSERLVVPLKIFLSVQSGRQYVMAYHPGYNRIMSYRIDNIVSVKLDEESPRFDGLRKTLEQMRSHIWGVSTDGNSGRRLEHVEFTVHYAAHETFIHQRLEREKRCGVVDRIDGTTSRFSADVYDATELIPWIRTFICRIVEIHFSDKELEQRFLDDIKEMYKLYGLEGGDLA